MSSTTLVFRVFVKADAGGDSGTPLHENADQTSSDSAYGGRCGLRTSAERPAPYKHYATEENEC
jgi:hypothetical protein